MEDNNCPKPTCGRPESTHRWSAGKRLSICGNGHSWDAAEIAAQREKAQAAKKHEFTIEFKAPSPDVIRQQMERFRHAMGGPLRNPFMFEA